MMDFEDFGNPLAGKPLSQADKAAAVLLAMGKGVAGKLLKFFTQAELQTIINSAQTLRVIPPDELAVIVAEFEDLFTEGTGLMDNAKAIESILEEGLTPEEVDGLLGRRAAFQSYETSIWDQLQDADPLIIGKFLMREHPQTIAYILSMLPSSFGAKVLLTIPDEQRADIMNRTVNMKEVSPAATQIIEKRVLNLIVELDAERNAAGSTKVADLMNELDKPQVDTLLSSLETLSKEAANKVKPKIFLFEDLLYMPQRSRVLLLNDISADILTMALRGATMEIKECVLACISPRQRRMIESDLAVPAASLNTREVAIARRAVAQEAIRLANSGQILLKEAAVAEQSAAA
ncbi:flagellar motor switch protein FliG [Agrobacterium rubi]|uniref:Flagellar motor switch protein FliG n=2 Tax=Agrobacterium rubi TaxID=28099 RepID=A0AAE7R298_9HYPH|nr:flagellar motor switch protein FliG [Agrobacterium rubi]MBP1879124.1 flagellar motor switch protein FliG [Agrobacterium rubi]MCL6652443.1 flagellar motor switch protein FliG [Agrobacterium rubi]NTE85357.1 flagellar motor switch protein FliG [Agrobacterium rubi]NTF01289.1 flagellar motor switch protein FliG [Agrobacterium rubi]NTF06413.1 flagellar motor switch protein FliG [Agrobacterium rubi]